MQGPRKIAFVTRLWSGYFQRLMRGVLRYADGQTGIIVRGFTLDTVSKSSNQNAFKAIQAWNPEGVLAVLMTPELDELLAAMPNVAMANMMACAPRSGVARVLGSMENCLERAIHHFRQIGIRSPNFLYLEEHENRCILESQIRNVEPSLDPRLALFIQPLKLNQLENPELPVNPIPRRLASWLKSLPKPAGIFCLHLGGGGYLIRVCRELGLRVPEDVAIAGVDDADMCLRSEPTLTSIHPSAEQVGYEALKILIRLIDGEKAPREIVRVHASEIHLRQSTGRKPENCDVISAVDYIKKHACEGITVDDVLQETQYVSRMTFYREFRKATGHLPGNAIRERQIEEACRLLASTELSITLVARMCGFSDNSAFARAFRAQKSVAPTTFRSRNK